MITISEERIMVYEDRDEMDLTEEDRLYEQNTYQASELPDTFREQLGDSAPDEDLMSEDEAAMAAAPMSEAEASGMEVEEFGETVTPAASSTTEDELVDETGFHPSPDETDED
jgi:hypothetical protein